MISLSEADLAARVRAVACYASQLSTFWPDAATMEQSMRRYARGIQAPAAERYWVV
ncbi:MAG: hypothetical protein HC915_16510 [Anaerolineae bacterium]|nr:hypothetical protein [Anaerolineae bacterium]